MLTEVDEDSTTVQTRSDSPSFHAKSIPATQIGEGLEMRPLGERVFLITYDRPWSANNLVVLFDDGTVVISDTPATYEATRWVLDWVIEALNPTQILAVNGHYHLDALGGNRAFIEADIPIYGLKKTAELATESAQSMLETLKADVMGGPHDGLFDSTTIHPPQRLFDGQEDWIIPLGNERLILRYPGHGHAPDNIVSYFPDHGVLFGGCMVKTTPSLGWTGDASLADWKLAIEAIQDMPATHVVGGHGLRVDPGVLDLTHGLLVDALSETKNTDAETP